MNLESKTLILTPIVPCTLEFLAWMFSQMDIKLLTSVLRLIEWLKELKIS